MTKLRSITGSFAGLCGAALLAETTVAQGLPPNLNTNAPVFTPALPGRAMTKAAPEPGMYQAEPYKMLVIVPGEIDSRMVTHLPATPRILQHAPEVELVPRARR